MTYTTDREMWWNDDRTRLVEAGDPAARFLLPAGWRFSLPDARKFGLVEDEPEAPAADAKQVEAPPANKARSAKETKGR